MKQTIVKQSIDKTFTNALLQSSGKPTTFVGYFTNMNNNNYNTTSFTAAMQCCCCMCCMP